MIGHGGKPYTGKWYRLIKIEGHPLAKANGMVYVHRAVLFEKIGPGSHLCHWCKKTITWQKGLSHDSIVADHVDQDYTNNDKDNLVPACHGCNSLRKRGWRIYEGDLFLVKANGSRCKGKSVACMQCGLSRTVRMDSSAKFCSSSCSSKFKLHHGLSSVSQIKVG